MGGAVPGGCSAQSGNDWGAHYKSGAPTTEACVHDDYQLICKGAKSSDAPTTTTTTTTTATTSTITTTSLAGGANGDPITVVDRIRVKFDLPKNVASLLVQAEDWHVLARADILTATSQWISDIFLVQASWEKTSRDILRISRKLLSLKQRDDCDSFDEDYRCPVECRWDGKCKRQAVGLQCTWVQSQSCGLDEAGVKKHVREGVESQNACEDECSETQADEQVAGCCWYHPDKHMCIYGERASFNERNPEVSAAACTPKPNRPMTLRVLADESRELGLAPTTWQTVLFE